MSEHKSYSGPYSEPEPLSPLAQMRRSEEVDDLDAECTRFLDSNPGPKDVKRAIILRAKMLNMLERLTSGRP